MKKIISIIVLLAAVLAATNQGAMASENQGGRHAVTLWWVIFNKPENCVGNPGGGAHCSSVDVFGAAFLESVANGAPDPSLIAPNLDAELGVLYATGDVTNARGKTWLVASTYKVTDNTPLALPPGADPMGFGRGLENENAEIHLVIRDHGRVNREGRIAQITNFLDPYCSDPNLLYFAGDNLCADEQFAIFAPGESGDHAVYAFADPASPIRRAKATLLRDGDVVRAVVKTRIDTTD